MEEISVCLGLGLPRPAYYPHSMDSRAEPISTPAAGAAATITPSPELGQGACASRKHHTVIYEEQKTGRSHSTTGGLCLAGTHLLPISGIPYGRRSTARRSRPESEEPPSNSCATPLPPTKISIKRQICIRKFLQNIQALS